jgi:hypothetical protein
MRLAKIRFIADGILAYKPDGCVDGKITNVLWDADKSRLCYEVEYENGFIDWVPTSKFSFEFGSPYRMMVGG